MGFYLYVSRSPILPFSCHSCDPEGVMRPPTPRAHHVKVLTTIFWRLKVNGFYYREPSHCSRLIFNDSRLLQCKPDRVICILPCIQQDIKIWIISIKNLDDGDVVVNLPSDDRKDDGAARLSPMKSMRTPS